MRIAPVLLALLAAAVAGCEAGSLQSPDAGDVPGSGDSWVMGDQLSPGDSYLPGDPRDDGDDSQLGDSLIGDSVFGDARSAGDTWACSPGHERCEAGAVQRCDGLTWPTVESCAGPVQQCRPGPADTASCVPTRSFALATTTAQAFAGQDPLYRLVPRDISADVDAISIHQDFLGVPWDAFRDQMAPPGAWVADIDALVAAAGSLDVFLSLALVNGSSRAHLDDRVTGDASSYIRQRDWTASCYDFGNVTDGAANKQAFINYALWMVDRFHPRWLNIALEINVFQKHCQSTAPEAWAALVAAEADIYTAIKLQHPSLIVFPSLVLEDLYGIDPTCIAATSTCLANADATYQANRVALAGLAMDRLAISSYPFGQGSIATPASIPADYLTRPATDFGKPLLMAEVGWSSESIAVKSGTSCLEFVPSSEQEATDFLDVVVTQAQQADADLVTFWSHRDLLPSGLSTLCPDVSSGLDCAGADAQWCSVINVFRGAFGESQGELIFKFFGTMGIRNYDGQAKTQLMARWNEVRTLPMR